MGAKSDEAKGRIKEAAGDLTATRPSGDKGGRTGSAERSRARS